jgi:hypothetical protein
MCNANALSMHYAATLTALSFDYTIAVGTTINATAVEITAQTNFSGDEDFWDRGRLPFPDAPISNVGVW